jgi:hypothetical protein
MEAPIENEQFEETIEQEEQEITKEKKPKGPRDRIQQFKRMLIRFADDVVTKTDKTTHVKDRILTIKISSIDKIAEHIRKPKAEKPVTNSHINKYTVFSTSFNPIVGIPSNSPQRVPPIPQIPCVDEHGKMSKTRLSKNTHAISPDRPSNVVKIADYSTVFAGKELVTMLRKEMNAWWKRVRECQPFVTYMDKVINEYKSKNEGVYEIPGLVPLIIRKQQQRDEKRAQLAQTVQAVPPQPQSTVSVTPQSQIAQAPPPQSQSAMFVTPQSQSVVAPTAQDIPIHAPTVQQPVVQEKKPRTRKPKVVTPQLAQPSVVAPTVQTPSVPSIVVSAPQVIQPKPQTRGRKRQPKNAQSVPQTTPPVAQQPVFTATLPNLPSPALPTNIEDFKLEGDDFQLDVDMDELMNEEFDGEFN